MEILKTQYWINTHTHTLPHTKKTHTPTPKTHTNLQNMYNMTAVLHFVLFGYLLLVIRKKVKEIERE